jgi:RNA recognition motif-containing protein
MKLYVGNIPYRATEKDLLELFDAWAPSGAKVLRDVDGRSKGSGFVFLDEVVAQLAINALDGFEFRGRHLMVSVARRQSSSDQRERAFAASARETR